MKKAKYGLLILASAIVLGGTGAAGVGGYLGLATRRRTA